MESKQVVYFKAFSGRNCVVYLPGRSVDEDDLRFVEKTFPDIKNIRNKVEPRIPTLAELVSTLEVPSNIAKLYPFRNKKVIVVKTHKCGLNKFVTLTCLRQRQKIQLRYTIDKEKLFREWRRHLCPRYWKFEPEDVAS